jgi:uncharacterized protein (TIGR02145 family)
MKKVIYLLLILTITSCKKDEDKETNSSSLTVQQITNVSHSSAECVMTFVKTGNYTEVGICLSTKPNPTTSDKKIKESFPTASYSIKLYDLLPNQKYYVRPYQINGEVTYGAQKEFTTTRIFKTGSGVTDIDGNAYQTVILGKQEWLAENLRTRTFSNGDPIPYEEFGGLPPKEKTAKYYYNNNDSSYNVPYGKFYNNYAINDSRNVCPQGWHVPAASEWDELLEYLEPRGMYGTNSAGGKMKSTGTLVAQTGLWKYPNEGANNSSGFNAVPAGTSTAIVGSTTYWWYSDDGQTTYVGSVGLENGIDDLVIGDFERLSAISCRCVKD